MDAQFSIVVDVPNSLVRITMAGFFTTDDIARFVAARNQAHQLLRCGINDHVTLVDIRNMEIQAQESVSEFQMVLTDRAQSSRRLAFVVAKSLARMQIKRAAESRDARYFMDADAAERWLLSDEDVTA